MWPVAAITISRVLWFLPIDFTLYLPLRVILYQIQLVLHDSNVQPGEAINVPNGRRPLQGFCEGKNRRISDAVTISLEFERMRCSSHCIWLPRCIESSTQPARMALQRMLADRACMRVRR